MRSGNTHLSTATPPSRAPEAGRRILVVDDNSDAADTLAMLLRLQGNEVRTSYSGAAALEVVHEFLPDIVFLDLAMPGMSGFEVAARLRATPEHASIFLVAVSGYAQESDRRRSREVGFDDHLVKPTDPALISALLAGPRSP